MDDCSFKKDCVVPGDVCTKKEENSCDLAKDFRRLHKLPCPVLENMGYPKSECDCDRPNKRIIINEQCGKSDECPASELSLSDPAFKKWLSILSC